jgi:murein L,D-transpeptidase YcbB/YkuD
VIGARTFAALTTPLRQRVRQIELSMERWRWLSATGRPNIVVNIPQFVLIALPRADDTGGEPLEMRAIVGQTYAYTRTPVFTTAITQVVFQPYWDVPSGILRREILPHIRANPSFLDRYQMEIVQGEGDDARVIAASPEAIARLAAGKLRLRQRPGALNALGPVKFVMPNPFSVYLHATPERALFERSQRTFSHGCIRVGDPAALAQYVLRDAAGDWNAQAVDAALCGTETLRIQLLRPVRVVVFYSTAVATQSEGVLFFEDVYGHDRKLQELLDARRRGR